MKEKLKKGTLSMKMEIIVEGLSGKSHFLKTIILDQSIIT